MFPTVERSSRLEAIFGLNIAVLVVYAFTTGLLEDNSWRRVLLAAALAFWLAVAVHHLVVAVRLLVNR